MKKILLVLLTALPTIFATAQYQSRFQKDWKTVDSLIDKSLPKSALEKIQSIYDKADRQNLPGERMKALIYQLNIGQTVKDNDINALIDPVEKDIAKRSDATERSLLQTLEAQLLTTYLSLNRWQILQRKETVNYTKTDIATWSAGDFDKKIHSLFSDALQNEKLKTTPVDSYRAVVIKGNVTSLRPTLFDLIVHVALDYYKTNPTVIIKPADEFRLTQLQAVTNTKEFIAFHFETKDTLSSLYQAVGLFQQVLAFHINDANPSAFVDADLERLQWCYRNLTNDEKEKPYLQSLAEILATYPSLTESKQASYLQAQYYADKAIFYQPYKDTVHRYDYVKAMEIINRNINTKDTSEGLINLLRLRDNILEKSLNMQIETVNSPGLPMRALFSYKNMNRVYWRVIKVPFRYQTNVSRQFWESLANNKNIAAESNQALPDNTDYQTHSAELKIDALPVGNYILLASSTDSFSIDSRLAFTAFSVSALSYISNGDDYFVLNRETGYPIDKALVSITIDGHDSTITDTLRTNSTGYFKKQKLNSDDEGFESGFISKNNDTLDFHAYFHWNYSQNNRATKYTNDTDYEAGNVRIYTFTDRSIYRPGQKIFFKGIAITSDRQTHNSKLWQTKRPIKVYLNDANDKTVDSTVQYLNDYSSFSGTFTIPANVLTGNFRITEENFLNTAENVIHVEEYKRPTFYVKFDTVRSAYKLNDSITITGYAKGYAGNSIDGAQAKVNITRTVQYPYLWLLGDNYAYYNSKEIVNDTVSTDKNGKFVIRFKATPDSSINKKTEPIFYYNISVNVTDNNGETRSAGKNIPVGYKNMVIDIYTPEEITVDSLKRISVATQNLDGKNIPTDVTVKIYPLQSPDRLIRQRLWQRPDQFVMDKATYIKYFPFDEYDNETEKTTWKRKEPIYIHTANDGIENAFPLNKMNEGWYYLEATAKDYEGNEIKNTKYIHAVGMGFQKNVFLYSQNKTPDIETGRTDSVLVGSGAKDVYVIQTLEKNDYKLKTTTNYSHFYLNEGQKMVTFASKKDDKYGAGFYFTFVKNNRLYTRFENINIHPPYSPLKIGYKTFRNMTEPGAKEKFIIRIKNADSTNANAELLSGMYDASLDQISIPLSWWQILYTASYPVPKKWNSENQFRFSTGFNNRSLNQRYYVFNKDYDRFGFSLRDLKYSYLYTMIGRLNSHPLNDVVVVGYSNETAHTVTGSATLLTSKTLLKSETAANPKGKGYSIIDGEVVTDNDNSGSQNNNDQLRTNFDETAFFYPQIHANKKGNYTIEFTMPDAVTTWKWMNLAYDKNLNFGYSEQNIISLKKLMIQPNIPRFLRAGDSIYLSAKITNLCNKALSGNATIEIIDPFNNKQITSWVANAKAAFSVQPDHSTSVVFPVNIPLNYTEPVSIIIKAHSGNYSDGEQHDVPVLTNRELVTESLPLLMKGDGIKSYSFDKLKDDQSKTLLNNSLTVEYTSNPVWYAVQSLPFLMQSRDESADETFNRFYADALGRYIVQSNPAIQKAYGAWKKDSSALQSNLEKNQELKQLLLSETPWVWVAEREDWQKRNVANLFDSTTANEQLTGLLSRLRMLQMSHGGFAWFRGGLENRYITQYILTGIGKLINLKSLPDKYLLPLSDIAGRAQIFLKAAIDNDYKYLIENGIGLNQDNLSPMQMQYLFAKSYFGKETSFDKAENYFYNQEKNYWNEKSNYFKSMIALTAYRHGDKSIAVNEIIKSVLENAVEDSAKGTYWRDNQWGYYWYQAPIQQQSLMIDVVNEIAQKENNSQLEKAAADMQQWLIINKQTNSWGTTKATADACYSLLNANKNLAIAPRNVSIRLGDLAIHPDKTEAETGYFKQAIKGKDVKNGMGNIAIRISSPDKNVTSPSYGGVYWQYFEDMDKITTAATNLSIHKKLFIEKNTNAGTQLFAVNDNDVLNVGDKLVVRIEIKTDRDMEFVHLKDMRAAAMEPDDVLSQYKWQDNLGYYESTKDASTDFFFDRLPKGTYVFDYPVHITHSGRFSAGIATIECMYAPVFSSHSEGFIIRVKKK